MVRAYTQYRIFEGSEEGLNLELREMQAALVTIVSVHKLYDSTYEILFHISTATDNLVEEMLEESTQEEE